MIVCALFPALVVLALVGLCVGSFLNVCIYRLPRRESVIWPAVRTVPRASAALSWYQNVPVFGWLVLRGRCRTCRARDLRCDIRSSRASAGSHSSSRPGSSAPRWLLVPRLVLTAALIVLFAIDLEHQILPNVITLPGIRSACATASFCLRGGAASLIGVAWGAAWWGRSRRCITGCAEGRWARDGRREDAGDDRGLSRLAADAASH